MDAGDDKGYTAMHFAAMEDRSDIIDILTEFKANVDSKTKEEWTPLYLAALSDCPEAATNLAEAQGFNLGGRDRYGNTLMHAAVKGGSSKIIRQFIGHSISPNAENNYGMTPGKYAEVMRIRHVGNALTSQKSG